MIEDIEEKYLQRVKYFGFLLWYLLDTLATFTMLRVTHTIFSVYELDKTKRENQF